MPRLNFDVDEATLLKTYQISSLHPSKWEEVDHDLEGATEANEGILSPTTGGATEREREDALGLGPAKSVKDLDNETKASVLLTSKTFSPAAYLSFAHPHATYHDLSSGIAHLQSVIEAREEALRVLVEECFDRFVAVKGSVDGLFEDMRVGILKPESEHATVPVRDYLRNGSQKANQIFLPVLETAAKAEKLRTTLSVFERSKFFFNLPSFIMESIDAGKYEFALRDYKKGKYLLENRPGQLLPISLSPSASTQSPASPTGNQQQQQLQRRILNKVWASVEKAMGELRKVLLEQLQDGSRSIEEQEKTLETLVELQTSDELVWTYFDSHHKQVMEKMNAAYKRGVKAIDNALRQSKGLDANGKGLSRDESLEMSLKSQLKSTVDQLEAKKQGDINLGHVWSPSTKSWDVLQDVVRSISEVVSGSLPSFWRISKDFMDGKYRKPNNNPPGGSRRSPSQCRTMANEIVKLYISLISQVFQLSEVAVMSRSQSFNSSSSSSSSLNKLAMTQTADTFEIPRVFPPDSNSLFTAQRLHKVLIEVQECAGDLGALEISTEVSSGLKSLVESLRWRFVDVLVHDWVRDARIFYHLETWVADAAHRKHTSRLSQPMTITTRHLGQFEMFQKNVTAAVYRLASNNNNDLPLSAGTKASTSTRNASTGISQTLMTKVTRGFVDAVYKFLDGLMLLASSDAPIVKGGVGSEGASAADRMVSPEVDLLELLDLKDGDVRILLIISNLQHFRKTSLPHMVKQLENAFGVSLTEDRRTLVSVVDELDKTLFEGYVRPRGKYIAQKIKKAVIGDDKFDWDKTEAPVTVLRPWVSEILDYLVEIHDQLYDAAPGLIDRTMAALLEVTAKETSRCFKQIKSFGTGGFLQALMELTFLHKSLATYAKECPGGIALGLVYTKEIRGAYPEDSDPAFTDAFNVMQRELVYARKITGIQYLCFRKQVESTGKEKRSRKVPREVHKERLT
ncbi:hypothetical protein D9613_008483 [Agrocybe pediades]|uniref:Exocyst complex component SEC5 n=1 Tax=Agrocybe pediades TaxID=84607 RepID=A0A8H4VQS5_9AGAR|nr:hypothetical protein D9613_008483 [Agrocybe pediades]